MSGAPPPEPRARRGATAPLSISVPAELVDAIVERVRAEVLAELQAQPKAPSPYMSIVEAAEYLRCSRQRVDDLLCQRRLTRFKDGSRTLVSRDEVEAHLRGVAHPSPTNPRGRLRRAV